jgi:hypothetical protein
MCNKAYTLILCVILFSSYLFASFPADTLITTRNAFSFVEALTVGQSIEFVDAYGTIVFKDIIDHRIHSEARYAHIIVDGDAIITTIDQKFYVPQERMFKDAGHLKVGDCLLDVAGKYIEILKIVIVEEEQEKEFFDITVDECHNFFASRSQVLVHNIGPLVVGLTWSFGAGAVEFAGATISACVAGIVVGIKARRNAKQCNYDGFEIDLSLANDAQAPGKPTENDGFVPKKNWDGKKVRHSVTGQYGYPDKKGEVWVPTGWGPLAHGGPHWDVVSKDGRRNRNVMPGGHVRGSK